ncbi:MAG TPA: oxygen-independent coproporphyrinogen III oxidase [Clostridiales bacterium]|nr:oxygen-independent coproporphyrinogen III oxidase [Clostridiales bacterium]
MITKNKIGIYVHIPFCKKKCDYCDFISYCGKDDLIEKYVDSVKKEIDHVKIKSEITTIYIGGGTPSYIDSKFIVQILEKIKEKNVAQDAEITIEVNPGTVTQEKLQDYIDCGINRISIGLQTTNDELLKQIGRIHNYEQFLETYKLAKKVGFKNINVDLMLGLPNQRIIDLKESLENVLRLAPKHISVYSLIVEEGTPIANKIKNGKLKLLDDELERNMYWYVKNTLELNGYKHYEISNFAKKGYESKHNMNCWNQMEYVGIGTAAHSYRDITRYSNTEDIKEYIKNVQKGEFEKNRIIHEIQKEEDSKKEFMLLGLRKIDGLKISEFKNKFGDNPIYLYRNELKKLSDEKLIIIQDDNIRLSNKGIDLANLVWEEFV